jgi:hypothetical protein
MIGCPPRPRAAQGTAESGDLGVGSKVDVEGSAELEPSHRLLDVGTLFVDVQGRLVLRGADGHEDAQGRLNLHGPRWILQVEVADQGRVVGEGEKIIAIVEELPGKIGQLGGVGKAKLKAESMLLALGLVARAAIEDMDLLRDDGVE